MSQEQIDAIVANFATRIDEIRALVQEQRRALRKAEKRADLWYKAAYQRLWFRINAPASADSASGPQSAYGVSECIFS